MSTPLQQLAQRHGVTLAFHDIWGGERQASPAVLAALLRAMHIDASDESAVERALADEDAERSRRVVPAVCVLGEPASVLLCLPVRLQAAALRWRVAEESGRTHEGELRADDASAITRRPSIAGDAAAFEWRLPLRLPEGYHRLGLWLGEQALGDALLIVAPAWGHLPHGQRAGGRVWGISVQLYALRSVRNWGIGDFTDLGAALECWGRRGAALVGVNPLHAMFPHNPAHASPYSPSHRSFLNALYLDVEAIAEFANCAAAHGLVNGAAFQARLDALRAADTVDYAGVAQAKWPVLELLFEHFMQHQQARGTERALAFAEFRRAGGTALHHQCLFDALQEHFHRADPAVWGWPVWPVAYRDPEGPAVRDFAAQQPDRVAFFAYVQWQCDLQLERAALRGLQHGAGLYRDVAVAADRAGAEAWSAQGLLALDASIGAPPDAFNADGQNWGLPPPIPRALERAGFAPFIATLRAGMRHSAALRIDHVMALMRLYWQTGAGGAFVHYPFEALLAIVRLESQRQRCQIIGEDLGTVPDGLRERLGDSSVLSYRVMMFEHDAQRGFANPDDWPRQALLVCATHDMPTLAGWWGERDLALRAELGLAAEPASARASARQHLIEALARAGLMPSGLDAPSAARSPMTPALSCAVHRWLARGPCQVVMAQIEDVFGQLDAVNLPGTTHEHPNWCRKLALDVQAWPDDPRVGELARALSLERPIVGRAGQALIPRATYRVQLHRGFTFAMATALVPYLAGLGVSHLYCSPFLRARAGSPHGYDIVDHQSINPEIGSRADLDALVAALRRHGLSMLLDVVPNHMGVHGGDNAWWLDVLESGPSSAYAEFFDIDWQSADPGLRGRVLLPILGEQYGLVLERGELRLVFDAAAGSFAVRYHDHHLPLDPSTYGRLIRRGAALARADGAEAGAAAELHALADAFDALPGRNDAPACARRRSDTVALKARLALQAAATPGLAAAIAAALESIAGEPGAAALDELLEAQAYRLAHWRVAADEINYRRFFDINDLAALRMERAEVFEATHTLVLSLLARGAADGLRIDHSDGLADPAAYFERLQTRYAEVAGPAGTPGAAADLRRPLYVVTEKITAPHERLPTDWAVHGTTGYRFANVVNGLLVDGDAKARLDRVWRSFVRDEAQDFDELAWRCRQLVMDGTLAGELTVLATALWRLAREDRRTRDYTLNSLRQALAHVVASFPVYRTYLVDKASPADRRAIDWAIGRARRRSLAADTSVFDFIRRVLLGRPPAGLADGYRRFARRLQQYTAPVAAKGIEDTALYRHHRLIALNDVGGDPDVFGTSISGFHGASRDRTLTWPHTLLATSTHDAKRSEDVRARVDVISEMPAAWRLSVRRWSRMNRSHKRTVGGASAPTRNDEYLLYQTLIGSLPSGPLDADTLRAYLPRVEQAMLKSALESKAVTSWINRNTAYEAALSAFVQAVLTPRDSNLFIADLRDTSAAFAWYGALNGLTLAVVKGLSPGVPDYYQGNETIDLSLVDPDNRRPVDFEHRRQLLAMAQQLAAAPRRAEALSELLHRAVDGRAKFWVTWATLRIRRTMPSIYLNPAYVPLDVHGERARHVVAFAVHNGANWVIAVAARLYASLGLAVGESPTGEVWGNTTLAWPADASRAPRPTRWIDQISDRALVDDGGAPWRVADLLCSFPVAALTGVTGEA